MTDRFVGKTISLVLALALAATGLLLAAPQTGAGELTAEQVMERVIDDKGVADMSSRMTMRTMNASGQERVRVINMQSKTGTDGLTKRLLRFVSPADVKGTAFLIIENKDRDDDRLLYLPALHKVRRIASSGRGGSFMGSDFSYNDLGRPKLKESSHRLLRSETVDGVDTYVIESVPKDKQSVTDLNTSKIQSWVRKDNFMTVKALYFDRDGKELKLLTAGNLQKIGGVWFTLKMEMKNLQEGTKTVIALDEVKVNSGLTDELFTERNLGK